MVFILAASKVVSGISQNGRACMVLCRAFSHGKWNEKRRTEGDLPAPEHRVSVSAQHDLVQRGGGWGEAGKGIKGGEGGGHLFYLFLR